MAQPPLTSQGPLIIEATRSHNDASQSVGLLCMSDRLDAGTSTSRPTTITKDTTSMPPAEFEPAILASKRQQTYTSDRAALGIGWLMNNEVKIIKILE